VEADGDRDGGGMSAGRMAAIAVAAVAAGGIAIALILASDHEDQRTLWAIFGPAVGWGFIGTGLYAARQRPESRTGVLMVLLGFAWFLSLLQMANAPLAYTIGLVVAGLWGSVFLHLGVSFPSGRLDSAADRAMVIAGYIVFPLAPVPALLFSGPGELDCGCPENLLLIRSDQGLADAGMVFAALAYAGLFVVVLRRSVLNWRAAGAFERLQLTPVYVCALLTFLLVTAERAGAGDAAWGAAMVSTALLPFAFLGGLLRTHLSQLDAELRARLDELRASRTRIVEAGDAERRRLERDLHDGAQSRLVALALLLGSARNRADDDEQLAGMLDRAQDELRTSLAELRELARGIHPAVLTERGLTPALQSLVARAPVPVTVDADPAERLPGAVESAAYFVVSEALANVAKYAQASEASVSVRRSNGLLLVDVTDDGIGGADAANGSGLRGLADRLSALDGRLSLESPVGRGTRLHAEIPMSQ
jgi:signal transduction histidine kinase